MTAFIKQVLLGECTGISFVDITPLRVCRNQRILVQYMNFYNYMADVFSNETKYEYEYWITSYFTKKVVGFRYDGIIYNSVQVQMAGLEGVKCIAFTPNAVDENLELVRATFLKLNYTADNIKILQNQEIDISTLEK